MHAHRPLLILLAVTGLLSLAVALGIKLTCPMPGYFSDTVEWAASGHIADTFTPLAYPLFIGPVFRVAGASGVLALQTLLQVALAAVAYLILRELRLPSVWSACGSLLVALHPDLILSVAKVWDVTLSTFLLLLFVLCSLRIARGTRPLSLRLTLAFGLVFAAAIFCRPNLILLAPLILLLLLHHRRTLSAATIAGHLAAFVIITAVGFSLLGVASHGSIFLPRNGPYNLYAGHNPLTMRSLLNNLNAEPALTISFLQSHPGTTNNDVYAPALGSYYTQQSILFARQHPGTELKLIFVKLFTLFRPDTKVHSLISLSGFGKIFMALPVVFFLAALLLPGRPPLTFEDRLFFIVEIAYVLPFLVTNSDPRFRTPLDAVLLLHLVSLIYRRRTASHPLSPA